jgi:hypothetical protein
VVGKNSRDKFLAKSKKEDGQPPAVLDEKYRKIAGRVSRENRGGDSETLEYVLKILDTPG